MIINETELIATIRSIPDFPKEGILFRDITTLLKNADAYETLVESIAEKLRRLMLTSLSVRKHAVLLSAPPLHMRFMQVLFLPENPESSPAK